ncbi:hypothetical protein GGX14DRAFT_539389 [Mycena pura]|uniref:Uncharacterized protein n=1 Tax=Mycena pura TaxID=153505 RepID=A0AAD6YS52_9AGAR|nr:hypothetical protein GGX14DRAFT_539389 [Mycena pura]
MYLTRPSIITNTSLGLASCPRRTPAHGRTHQQRHPRVYSRARPPTRQAAHIPTYWRQHPPLPAATASSDAHALVSHAHGQTGGETAGVAGPTLACEAAKQRRMRARLRRSSLHASPPAASAGTHLASTVAHVPARWRHRPTSTRTARRSGQGALHHTRGGQEACARSGQGAHARSGQTAARTGSSRAVDSARVASAPTRRTAGPCAWRTADTRAVNTTRTAVHAAADSAPTCAANSAGGQRAADTARTVDRKPTRPRRIRAHAAAVDSAPTRASDSAGGQRAVQRTRPRRIVRPHACGGQRARARRTGSPRADSVPMRTADSERTRRRAHARGVPTRAADSACGGYGAREWRTGSPRAATADINQYIPGDSGRSGTARVGTSKKKNLTRTTETGFGRLGNQLNETENRLNHNLNDGFARLESQFETRLQVDHLEARSTARSTQQEARLDALLMVQKGNEKKDKIVGERSEPSLAIT